jgi:hypothetical protein
MHRTTRARGRIIRPIGVSAVKDVLIVVLVAIAL